MADLDFYKEYRLQPVDSNLLLRKRAIISSLMRDICKRAEGASAEIRTGIVKLLTERYTDPRYAAPAIILEEEAPSEQHLALNPAGEEAVEFLLQNIVNWLRVNKNGTSGEAILRMARMMFFIPEGRKKKRTLNDQEKDEASLTETTIRGLRDALTRECPGIDQALGLLYVKKFGGDTKDCYALHILSGSSGHQPDECNTTDYSGDDSVVGLLDKISKALREGILRPIQEEIVSFARQMLKIE